MYTPISPYENYCAGYGNPGTRGRGYFLAYNLGVGKVKKSLSHSGSQILDATVAFDKAEVEGAYLGQTNMITVSSFCGPNGRLWGYDVVRQSKVMPKHSLIPEAEVISGSEKLKVYSANPLTLATEALFGTTTRKHFPIYPGSHLPCAMKNVSKIGPAHLYCALGVGIPIKRATQACLMMEDVGVLSFELSKTQILNKQKRILKSLCQSILMVGKNQAVKYKLALVDIKMIKVEKDEIGCALVAAPYFTLAKKAVPQNGMADLSQMSLQEWQNSVE